jgi:prolyl-tRNA synthetase
VKKLASGIYSYLPLGLRTLSKITKIIDEEMESVGGQKLNMPKMLPRELWEKTGRWNDMGSELIRLKDRKGEDFCLAPTHEEIVTQIAASGVSSHKQLPLRLYQIGDKYRDEARPRFGLLRAREFIMKDMYSFDVTQAEAMVTYEEVRGAYNRIMTRLQIPYAIAEADSGNIGGNLSHEFHALTAVGEDSLLCCSSSQYHANVEKAKSKTVAKIDLSMLPPSLTSKSLPLNDITALRSLLDHLSDSQVNPTMRAAYFSDPANPGLAVIALTDASYESNPFLVKGLFKLGADFTHGPLNKEAIEGFMAASQKKLVLDKAFGADELEPESKTWVSTLQTIFISAGAELEMEHVKLVKVGDPCNCNTPNCLGGHPLEERKGIEVGHLFYLGTKYSKPMKANVASSSGTGPIEMGCYGIGVSRLLAVAVETSNDSKGIIWPRSIAPYRVMVIAMKQTAQDGESVFDALNQIPSLNGEVMLDDRYATSVGYRLKESEFIGIPYAVVLGNKFETSKMLEVISRKDGASHQLALDQLSNFFQTQFHNL